MDAPIPVSEAQQGAWQRTLSIGQQPLMVMQYLKDGTLTSKDMIDFVSMYPSLYDNLKNRLLAKLPELEMREDSISPAVLTSLSLFLEIPLTASLKPQAIMSNQQAISIAQQKQQAPTQGQTQALDKLASSAASTSQKLAVRKDN